MYKFCEVQVSHPPHVWNFKEYMSWVDPTTVYAGIEYQCPGWGQAITIGGKV